MNQSILQSDLSSHPQQIKCNSLTTVKEFKNVHYQKNSNLRTENWLLYKE